MNLHDRLLWTIWKIVKGVDPESVDDDPVAQRLRQQLRKGEFRQAEEAVGGNRDWDARAFYVGALSDWKGRPQWFDRWTALSPESPIPWLVRGAHSINWAWEARGDGVAESVAREGVRLFAERLLTAIEDLARAAQLDPGDPTPGRSGLCARSGSRRGTPNRRHTSGTRWLATPRIVERMT